MKIEIFSSIEELKADRIPRKLSDKERREQEEFVNELKKVRERNLNSNSSNSL